MERISKLEKKYVNEALNNQFRTSLNSIFCSKLEKIFCEKFNSKYSISCVNGTATMHIALAALGVKKDDEVIVPPLTMSSTALSVLQNGSVPVFADVDKDTFNILPESIEKQITDKTKAVITVALYGLSPDYDKIIEICKKHNLFLIEDNAECFYGYYKGKIVGEFGDFASFSFQASKHLTCGEGGMLTTNNENYANEARRFSSLGYAGVGASKGKITKDDIQNPNYDRHVSLGFNYRMSEVTAAVALGQVERIDELIKPRIETAKIFDSAIKDFSFIHRQKEPEGYINSYWSYSFILDTDEPETDWFRFRKIFQGNSGDNFYAAWKLSYFEPYFKNILSQDQRIWQNYEMGLCPNAEHLQPRMVQMKTNYWDIKEAKKQAEILYNSLKKYSNAR